MTLLNLFIGGDKLEVKALTNFAGIVTMTKGEVKDIAIKDIVDDLLKAKYVQKVTTKRNATKKKGDSDESK